MLLFRLFADKIKKCIDEKYHHLVSVEPPKNIEFGDFSTNIALRLSAHLESSPMQIAEQLLQQLQVDPDFQDINIKKPGFINWKVPLNLLLRCLPHMLKNDYGRLDLGNGNKVNIEYVSANPTGPLHVGHAPKGALKLKSLGSSLGTLNPQISAILGARWPTIFAFRAPLMIIVLRTLSFSSSLRI